MVYGPELGANAGDADEDGDDSPGSFGTRLVKAGNKVKLFYILFLTTLGIFVEAFHSAVLYRRRNPVISYHGT